MGLQKVAHFVWFSFFSLFLCIFTLKKKLPLSKNVFFFLQPAKDVELWTVRLKSCRQEKKSMMNQDSLDPAAIRFTLERLQESARQSGHFLPALFMLLYPQEP